MIYTLSETESFADHSVQFLFALGSTMADNKPPPPPLLTHRTFHGRI